MAKKPKYQAEGWDYTPSGGFATTDLDINLPGTPTNPGPVRGAGTPISKVAFQEIKSRYTSRKGPNDTEYVTFSRESLLTILAQNDCAGIKFHFVERMNTTTKQLTLALVGVDVNNVDLTTPSTTGGASSSGTQDTLSTDAGSGFPPTT